MCLCLLRAVFSKFNSWVSPDNLAQRTHESVAKEEIKINIKWEKFLH